MTDAQNFSARITELEKALIREFEDMVVLAQERGNGDHLYEPLSQAWRSLSVACAVARDYDRQSRPE